MSYELNPDESFADGIRRVVVEQVEMAAEILSDPRIHGGLDEAIHNARKCFKRVRSGLRLARTLLRKRDFRRENGRFRELGLLLSGPRESGVAIATIDGLADHFGSVLRPDPFASLRAHFVERHVVALWTTVEGDEGLIRAGKRLGKARAKLLHLLIGGRSGSGTSAPSDAGRASSDLAWTKGIRRAYKAGGKLMELSYLTRSPEAFHEWRKQAKHLRYHLRILRPAWGGQLDRAEDLLHDLTDRLGDHHDLTDLRRQLSENPALRTTATRRDQERTLRALIDGRRMALEDEIHETGLRIYSRKPDQVLDRLEALWKGWRPSL